MMKYFYYLIIFFIIDSAHSAIPEINVKIGSKVKHLKITSDEDFDFYFLRGNYQNKSTQKKLEFNCDFNVSKENKTILFASLISKNNSSDLVFENKGFGSHIKLATSSESGCDVIQSVKINHYLESLLSKEMNGSWPLEALKAQAVAARSYALDKIKNSSNRNFNIISGEIHQVSGSSEDVTRKTRLAVNETLGEVLINNESVLVPGYYHAECGGRTFDPIDVWSGHIFDYKSTNCPYCHEKSQKKNWKKEIDEELMLSFIEKYHGNKIKKIESVEIIDSKKVHLKINGKNYIFFPSDFRKNLLSIGLKSNNFYFAKYENKKFLIKGSGRGHGVGMCQLGALKMAELGYNYKEILNFYYPKLNIKKVY